MSRLVSVRNRVAHETEVPFAKLLVSKQFYKGSEYCFWGPLFVFCYGKTVEELIASSKEDNDIF